MNMYISHETNVLERPSKLELVQRLFLLQKLSAIFNVFSVLLRYSVYSIVFMKYALFFLRTSKIEVQAGFSKFSPNFEAELLLICF